MHDASHHHRGKPLNDRRVTASQSEPADEGPGRIALGQKTLQIRPGRRKGVGEGGVQRLL